MRNDKDGNIIGMVSFHLDELIDSNRLGHAVLNAVEECCEGKSQSEIIRQTKEALSLIAHQAKKAAYSAKSC